MGRVLGLDVGDRRIGLALSDSGGILASPLTIIEHSTEQQDIAAILKIAQEHGAEYRDERLTTVTAQRLKQETSSRRKNKVIRYDAMAAAVILQDYLEEQAIIKKRAESGSPG